MKKATKIFLATLGTAVLITTGIGVSYLIADSFTSSSNNNSTNKPFPPFESDNPNYPSIPPFQSKPTLTTSVVMNNFAKGGIWENKTSLTSDDLSQFSSIDSDCFDYLTKPLDFIELPNNMYISNSSLYQNDLCVRWNKVNKILVSKNTLTRSSQKLVDYNGLIYSCFDVIDNIYLPITISDRTKPLDIRFPDSKTPVDIFPGDAMIRIPNNFYTNININNLVKSISFDNTINPKDPTYTLVTQIGTNAFKNCNLLPKDLVISPIDNPRYYNSKRIKIGASAFENTNIESLTIDNSPNQVSTLEYTYLGIGDLAFAGNKKLSKIKITSINYFIGNQAFSNCSRALDVEIPMIFDETFIHLGNEIFANTTPYDSLNLKFPLNKIDYTIDWSIPLNIGSTPFSSITMNNINNFNFKIGYPKEQTNAELPCDPNTSVLYKDEYLQYMKTDVMPTLGLEPNLIDRLTLYKY